MCGGDSPPVITSAPVTGAIVTKPYRYLVDAEDPDEGDTLTFLLDKAPEGMAIHPTTGEITWTPETNQATTHTVRLRVSRPDRTVRHSSLRP